MFEDCLHKLGTKVNAEASPHARIKELAVANLLRGLLNQPFELLSSFGSDVGLHKSTNSVLQVQAMCNAESLHCRCAKEAPGWYINRHTLNLQCAML